MLGNRRYNSHVYMDEPIGNPYGGPAYGLREDPMTVATTVATQVIGSALGGGGGGGSPAVSGAQAQQMVDPFAQYRPQYASQLNQFMQSPNVSALPGFQQDLSQGTQALQRQAAQTGQIGSGRELMALQDYAMNLSNQYYQQQIGNLGSLSGATSPQVQIAGGNAGVGASNAQAQSNMQVAGGLTSGLAGAIKSASLGGQQTQQYTNIDPAVNYGTSSGGSLPVTPYASSTDQLMSLFR